MLKNFDDLLKRLKSKGKKKIAVAMAQDADAILALEKARAAGLTDAVLIGSNEELGEAHVVMKGLCSTAVFLKGILDKENGLRSAKALSHLAIFESPNYHKLIFMSDAAMNIAPDLNDKIAITENAVSAAHALGYEKPKTAMISAVEKVNASAMPSTADAAIIAKMADRKQIKDVIIDGPLAVDNALSSKANEVKGLVSPVGGDADICIVPNIETGNVFYKLLTVLGDARVAGVILGASAPVVLTSRADSEDSKYLSIVSALCISK
jgi:phosphate butyryltransferase